ncbi:MAG: CmcJ/NvfI family oxidoreductase, partial [Gammaproteobacteria bacterium]
MSTTAAPRPLGEPTRGTFHYLADATVPSLYRNGRVLTRRDADGSDGGSVGVELAAHERDVHDARQATCNLARNGFELLDDALGDEAIDFLDHVDVIRRYYGRCAALVAAATGGQAIAFDHNVRSASARASARRISGGQRVQGPAHVVHGDYTLTGAPQRLRDLARPPSGNDTLRAVLPPGTPVIEPARVEHALSAQGRFAIVNLWRNIAPEPVETHPLALCDAQCVSPSDLVVFEIHYPDRVGENYFARQASGHRF